MMHWGVVLLGASLASAAAPLSLDDWSLPVDAGRCAGGLSAGVFPCLGVDLLARVPLHSYSRHAMGLGRTAFGTAKNPYKGCKSCMHSKAAGGTSGGFALSQECLADAFEIFEQANCSHPHHASFCAACAPMIGAAQVVQAAQQAGREPSAAERAAASPTEACQASWLAFCDEGPGGNDMWGWVDPSSGREYALVNTRRDTAFFDVTSPLEPRLVGVLPMPNLTLSAGEAAEAAGVDAVVLGSSWWHDIKVSNGYAFIVSETAGHGLQVFELAQLGRAGDTAAAAAAATAAAAAAAATGAASATGDGGSRSVPQTFEQAHRYLQYFHKAHNIAICEETGVAFVLGSDACKGLLVLNVSQPTNVLPVGPNGGCFSAVGFLHDCECVVYRGADAAYAGRELCFCGNQPKSGGDDGGEDDGGGRRLFFPSTDATLAPTPAPTPSAPGCTSSPRGQYMTIIDVTDKRAGPHIVACAPYPGGNYAHQGWLTRNQSFVVFSDESDESIWSNAANAKAHGPTRSATMIFDVRRLSAPALVAHWLHPRIGAITHNLYVRDGLVFQADYTAGVRVLRLNEDALAAQAARRDAHLLNVDELANGANAAFETSCTACLEEIAFFDTFPDSDATNYDTGVWTAYPFLPSGTLVVNTETLGMFTLKLQREGGLSSVSGAVGGFDATAVVVRLSAALIGFTVATFTLAAQRAFRTAVARRAGVALAAVALRNVRDAVAGGKGRWLALSTPAAGAVAAVLFEVEITSHFNAVDTVRKALTPVWLDGAGADISTELTAAGVTVPADFSAQLAAPAPAPTPDLGYDTKFGGDGGPTLAATLAAILCAVGLVSGFVAYTVRARRRRLWTESEERSTLNGGESKSDAWSEGDEVDEEDEGGKGSSDDSELPNKQVHTTGAIVAMTTAAVRV